METMKVIFVRPEYEAEVKTIGRDLASMQKAVGGNIEAIYSFEDPIAIICNEDGKLNGLPLNRALTDNVGQILDVIAGDFFICGLTDEDFTSLSDEMLDKYLKKFKYPESFMKVNDRIMAVQHERIRSHKGNDIDEEFLTRLEEMFSYS